METSELVELLRDRGLVVRTGDPDDQVTGGRRLMEVHAGLNVIEQSFVLFRASDGWRLIVSRAGKPDLDIVVPDLETAHSELLREYGLSSALMVPSRAQRVLVAALGALALDGELAERLGAFAEARRVEAPTSADACNWLHATIDHHTLEGDPEALLDQVTELGVTTAERLAPHGHRAIEAFHACVVGQVIEVLRARESDLDLVIDDTPLGALARDAREAFDLEDLSGETRRAVDSTASAFTTAWTTLAFGE